jgi:SpoVK/Ycf46/Vps4 family AAA+-type ATPase
MLEAEYRAWLQRQGKEPATLSTSCSAVRRIETACGDLGAAFGSDGLESINADLAYSGVDRKRNEPNPSKPRIEGDIYNGLSSARTHLGYYRRFLEERGTERSGATDAAGPAPSDHGATGDDAEAIFSLERDPNAALRQSISQIEPGMTIIDGGAERSVPSGRIDILARDSAGRIVVIELKATKATRDAVGQVLAYMGDLSATEDVRVRGVLIAPDFDHKAIAAARMAPTLSLRRFTYKFAFEAVG